jgi:hypothetical protein
VLENQQMLMYLLDAGIWLIYKDVFRSRGSNPTLSAILLVFANDLAVFAGKTTNVSLWRKSALAPHRFCSKNVSTIT